MHLQLISLDLDGTIACYEPQLDIAPEVIPVLARASEKGIRWLLNSDRWIEDMEEIAERLPPEQRPCGLLTRQKDIFFLADDGSEYLPCDEWNDAQEILHRAAWQQVHPFFAAWEREIRETFSVQMSFVTDQVFAFCVPPNQAPDLVEFVADCCRPWSELKVSGNHEWIFLIHAEFSKARLLTEAAARMGISAAEILAVGDGLNDLSIFDGVTAGMTGCPANACTEVMQAVRSTKGMVATAEGPPGTVQVLEYFLRESAGASG